MAGESNQAPSAAPAAPSASNPAPANAAPIEQAALDEDAQIIEDLRREHFAKQSKEKGEAEKEEPSEDQEPEEDEPSESEEEEQEEKKEPEKKEKKKGDDKAKSKAPTVKYKSGEAAVAAIVKAIESGDLAQLAKALGKPESFVKVTDAKWLAFRERSKAVTERERVVAERETGFNAKLEQAKKEYGPAIEAAAAYREGKLDRFVELVEALTGDSYDEASRKVIKGETSLDPEVKRLRREIAELKQAKAAEREEEKRNKERETIQERTARAVAAVQSELADHPVSHVKGYERMVLDKIRESWDPDLEEYTMSFDEAADAIVEERRAEARHFSRGKQLPAPRVEKRQPNEEPPPRSRATDARPPEGDPWLTRDLTEEELVGSIVRDARLGRIKPV